MCADHIICPNHGFAIARRIRQISIAVLLIEQGRSRACARSATATCPATIHLAAPRVDDCDISGYFRRQVIAATSARDAGFLTEQSLNNLLPNTS